MNQWLNRLVALIVALLLGTTVFIALQNPPPPSEVRRPEPSPTVSPLPTATPMPPTPQGIADLPLDRAGMILASQPDGTLRLIPGNGDRSWPLALPHQLTAAAWSPDGRHIVAATEDGNVVMTHPERQDSLMLLSGQQRLAGPVLSWKDSLTVALAYQDERAPATIALWSYRSRSLEAIGSGRAPAATSSAVAWIALDGRSIVLKRDGQESEILVSSQQLDNLFPSRQADTSVEIAQSLGTPLVWSASGNRLAFVAITRNPNTILEWSIAVVDLDGALRHWVLPSDSAVYQLGWFMEEQLLFTEDRGLSAINPVTGSLNRLLPQVPVNYFATSSVRNDMILSLPTGLHRVPITDLESAQPQLRPFGPPAQGHQRIDWCCLSAPRPELER